MNESPGKMKRLRKRIKGVGKSGGGEVSRTEFDDMSRLVHELETYQTELLQANDELRETQQRLEQIGRKYFDLYDLAPVGYLTLNSSGLITRANLAAAELLGTERSRLNDRRFSVHVHPDSLPEFTAHCDEVRKTGGSASCETRLKAPGNEEKYVQLNCRPEPDAVGNDVSIWVTLSDISEKKQLQREREKLYQDLGRHSRLLEQSNQELDAFNYSVSHDLRAPVRSVLGFAEALAGEAEETLPDRTRDYLERIVSSAHHMKQIIDGLLALSRVSRADMRQTSTDLARLAREITRDLKDRDPERRVMFLIDDDLIVHGDERMLRMALDNLLSNAWKYTLKTDSPRIELVEETIDDTRTFVIRDNGAGFDAVHASRLFEPFQRLHREKEYGGIGIGLTIVDRVIRRHGGNIWAEGEKGAGAAFYFTVPEREKE